MFVHFSSHSNSFLYETRANLDCQSFLNEKHFNPSLIICCTPIGWWSWLRPIHLISFQDYYKPLIIGIEIWFRLNKLWWTFQLCIYSRVFGCLYSWVCTELIYFRAVDTIHTNRWLFGTRQDNCFHIDDCVVRQVFLIPNSFQFHKTIDV